jgi:outer membrane protein
MKRLLLMCVAFSALASAQDATQLTLNEAIRIGRENSRTLRVSAAKVDAARGKAGSAGAALLPSLKFEGSYRRFSDVPPFEVQLPILPRPIVVSPTILDNYALRLSLQQPVFTGFKLRSNARAAEALAEASERDNVNDRDDLDVTIAAAYWTLYQTQETRKFADENVARLKTYLRDTENLMKAGMATRNDYLKIQLQLNNSRLMQIDAINDGQVAMMNLNNVMSRPLEAEVRLVSSPGEQRLTDSTLATMAASQDSGLTAIALRDRHDIQALESRVEASRAGVMAARGNWWPQIFLSANYYYSNPNSRYLPALAEFKDTWDLGVTLQFDLWNWGQTGYETDQAQAALVQNQTLLAQLKENISLDVKKQLLNWRRSEEKVEVTRLGVDQAEENLRTTDDKFKSGAATSTDLLDANVSLLQARTNLTGALVEQELAQARLRRAIGRPVEAY